MIVVGRAYRNSKRVHSVADVIPSVMVEFPGENGITPQNHSSADLFVVSLEFQEIHGQNGF